MNRSDWIVVGAGSAGCIVAARLASEAGIQVTLVEPPSTQAPEIDRQRPSRWLNLCGSEEDWKLQTESCERLAKRQLNWPRGRGLGGSSRINAMIWFPPTPADLQNLSDASDGLWSVARLEKAFLQVQRETNPESPRWLSEASQRFLEAASGIPDSTPMVYQRLYRSGRRWNPASLLEPSLAQGSLRIARGLVDQLLWDDDRVVGAKLVGPAGTEDVRADRGVILCAGAVATPTILMRSGIGGRDELSSHRIDVRVDCSSVGANLRDHLIMPIVFETASGHFFDRPSIRDIAQWQTLGGGPIASNIAECGGLFRGQTLQVHVTPTHYLTFRKSSQRSVTRRSESQSSMMSIGVNLTQPKSSGQVRLRSRSADQAPAIHPGYLNDPSDLTATVDAVRFARSLATETALADWIEKEVVPGSKRTDDAAIAKSISRYAQTLYHPVGTCRMGASTSAVVAPDFSVRGTQRLWIADASALPGLTIGNPNATVMLLGWLAAESLRE